VDAFVAAAQSGGKGATVVASLPEDLPEHFASALMHQDIAPMHGLPDCLDAIANAAAIGAAKKRLDQTVALPVVQDLVQGPEVHQATEDRAAV
jgi:acetyl-CoA synthetase